LPSWPDTSRKRRNFVLAMLSAQKTPFFVDPDGLSISVTPEETETFAACSISIEPSVYVDSSCCKM
jgi:hypothetical protein